MDGRWSAATLYLPNQGQPVREATMAISFDTTSAPSPRLLDLIERERAIFCLGPEFEAEYEARGEEMADLYREIVNFPCASLADVKVKAAYAARLMGDCDVDL